MLLLLGVFFFSACDQSDYEPLKSSQPASPAPVPDKQIAQPKVKPKSVPVLPNILADIRKSEAKPQSAPAPESKSVKKIPVPRPFKLENNLLARN